MLSAAVIPVALVLSSCGGGSDSATPTPTPTPTATPTPTPVSYSAFPLTGATEFGTLNAFTSFTGDPASTTTPITLGAAGTEAGGTRFRVAVLPDPATASTATGGSPVVVRENLEEDRFNAVAATGTVNELTVAPATTVDEYVFNNTALTKNTSTDTTTTPVLFSTAEFLNNTVTGKVTATTALALTETSYTGWYRGDSATGQKRITYGAWGYPTVASDMLTTGTATYTARVVGRAVRRGATGGLVNKLGGTVTVSVDWSTGLVTTTVNMTLIETGGAVTPIGTFTGSGAIAVGATQFTGSFGPSSPIPGTFSGAFFGSHGAEIGISFATSGSVTLGGTTYDTRAVGLVIGKKN
ncbi:hypothetical protein [Sphingomonas sp.]|uniref:hypothetical protein n=1 Tax=Sphingomonas sp. TaxID=28214 RepID=UPI0025DE65B7|nr:hypothetical protein [Sphingomonas sp.]